MYDLFFLSIYPKCCLHVEQFAGGGGRAERGGERGSGRCPPHHHGPGGGTAADSRHRGGGRPRHHPHQRSRGEAACSHQGPVPG